MESVQDFFLLIYKCAEFFMKFAIYHFRRIPKKERNAFGPAQGIFLLTMQCSVNSFLSQAIKSAIILPPVCADGTPSLQPTP